MVKIWEENEVTMDGLVAHLRDSGTKPNSLHDDEAWFRTESGIGYCVAIMDDKKFVKISTYLPLDPAQSQEAKLQFEHRLNRDVFLPVFCLDGDGDLTVTYVMPYAHGLIAGQFAAIVNRFADLLDYIVSKQNGDGIIDFGTHGDSGDQSANQSSDSDDQSANQSNDSASVPPGVLLN